MRCLLALFTLALALAARAAPVALALDATRDRLYLVDESADTVAVLDANTLTGPTIPVGMGPRYVAVHEGSGRAYVSNIAGHNVTVLDGAQVVGTVASGGAGAIAIHPRRHRVYVARSGNTDEVNVIDGGTLSTFSMAIESYGPVDLALHPDTNRLYVANAGSGQVSVVDVSSESAYPRPAQLGVWSKPSRLAIDPARNRLFVVGEDPRGPIAVVDTTNHSTRFVMAPNQGVQPRAIAVDPGTGRGYAVFRDFVAVIDGAAVDVRLLPIAAGTAVAVDAASRRVAVATSRGMLAVIDGDTLRWTTTPIAQGATALAVHPRTGVAFVAYGGGVHRIDLRAASLPAAAAVNPQGLWWASPPGSESGWGMTFSLQGETLFATWFTYDDEGRPTWFVMSDGRPVGANAWRGTLHRTRGPAFGPSFDRSQVRVEAVGEATFAFQGPEDGGFTATVGGTTIAKAIVRQRFASPVPDCAVGGTAGAQPVYQDLWWASPAGAESGWGVHLTHQGDVLFAAWFTYGADGRATWLVGSRLDRVGPGEYEGTLYRMAATPWSWPTWNGQLANGVPAGSIRFAFRDAANGTMTASVDGITLAKPVTRQVFGSPPTTCR